MLRILSSFMSERENMLSKETRRSREKVLPLVSNWHLLSIEAEIYEDGGKTLSFVST